MQFYISKYSKKFVTRNNGISSIHPKLFNHTKDTISFSIVDEQNQIQNLPSGQLYLAASYQKRNGKDLILLCNSYTITDKIVTFTYSTNSYQFLNLIQGDNVEIKLEIGVINNDDQGIILSDFGYASQRYYIQGMPEPDDLNAYYTKTEISGILSSYATQAWVIEKIEEVGVTKEYVDNQDEYLSGQIDLKASTISLNSHVDNSNVHTSLVEKTLWTNKQNAINSSSKLDYALISGAPTIPTKTSDLTNDSSFMANPSGGSAGQILKKTDDGLTWDDETVINPVNLSIEFKDCSTAGTFVGDFNGKQIQRYNSSNATSGTISINYVAPTLTTDAVPTIEVQIPVNGAVSTITIPSSLIVVDIPQQLEHTSGIVTYHDFVLRSEKDLSGQWKNYINYAYNFNEGENE